MDTLNLIEKILFVFTDNIWIFYLAVCLRQQVRMKAGDDFSGAAG